MSSFLFLILFGFIQYSHANTRGTSISASEEDGLVTFTLNYIASVKPEVMWRDRFNDFQDGYSNDFDPSTGTGVTSLTVDPQVPRSITVSLYEQGSNVTVTYTPKYTRGEGSKTYDIPEARVWSPLGDEWVYEAGVPLDVVVRLTKNNGNYLEPQTFWSFIGVDEERDHPILELATSYDAYHHLVTETTVVNKESYLEATATATLTAKQGVVGVTVNWMSGEDGFPMISVEKVFTIRERSQSGPFPPGFIGVYQPLEFIGRSTKKCVQGDSCSIQCVAVGLDIASLELIRTGEEQKIQASLSSSLPAFTFAMFDVRPQTDADFTSYTCRATSSEGTIAETNVLVIKDRSPFQPGPPLP